MPTTTTDTQKKKLSNYEAQLVQLIDRVAYVQDLMSFSTREFTENFGVLPLEKRIELFLQFSTLQSSMLDTLRKSAPQPAQGSTRGRGRPKKTPSPVTP